MFEAFVVSATPPEALALRAPPYWVWCSESACSPRLPILPSACSPRLPILPMGCHHATFVHPGAPTRTRTYRRVRIV